LAQEQ